MEPYTLLIVARTQSLATRLRDALAAERYLIRWVPSTTQALKLELCPLLLIWDLPPSGGARSVIRLKRQFEAPLLALSRTGQPVPESVDVFLSRPYHMAELVEQIDLTLLSHSPHMVRAAGMYLDTETRRLQLNGAVHQLRPIGCQIVAELMLHAGQVVPRDDLFRRIWHTDDGDRTRALDVHIAYLRRELEADPRQPRLILTERGVGYRLQPPD